jgi:hypothetical protein
LNEDPGFNEKQDAAVRSERLDAVRPDDSHVVQQQDARGIVPAPGFLETVYGVLFEPVKTMKKAAENPPLAAALMAFTVLSLLGAVMGLLAFSKFISQGYDAAAIEQLLPGARALVPAGIFIGLVLSYVKWFCYSAIIHLIAELLGGRGSARGVFAAFGLAGLPYILLIPFQLLGYWYGTGEFAVTALLILAWLAVGLWSGIIFVIGVMEVHALSMWRSVLVLVIPFLAMISLLVLSLIGLAVMVSAFAINTNIPGYF